MRSGARGVIRYATVGAGLGLVLFTAVSRFIWLDQLPPGLWFDEAWVSVQALGNETPVYFAANFGGMHPAIVYLTRLFQPLLDYDPLTIRYAVAVISVLTVMGSVAAYRPIFQPTADSFPPPFLPLYPFLAAFILSILYPFFHFSRLGFESILPLPAALLAFGLLAGYLNQWSKSGLRMTRSVGAWLLGLGVVCGLSLYLFDTARFIPLALAVAFWWAWLAQRPRPSLWPTAVHFGVIVGTAVLISAPLLLYFAQNWPQLTERAAVTTYNTLGPGADSMPRAIGENIGRTVGGLFLPGWGDGIARHNLPGRPVFDPFLGGLFGLGLLVLGRRPFWQPTILLFSWLVITLLPVVLTDGAPTYTRLFGAVPALAGITAVGGLWVLTRGRRWGMALLLAGLVFSTAVTLTDYFVRWPATPQLFDDFQVGPWQAGQLALRHAQHVGEQVYFVPDKINLDNPTLALLLNDTAVRPHPPAPCLLLPAEETTAVTYVIDELADKQMGAWLDEVWHTAVVTQERVRHQPSGNTIYRARTLPAGSQLALELSPAPAQFGTGLVLHSQQITHDAQSLQLTTLWEAITPLSEPYTLFVHLYPMGAEDAAPVAQLDVAPCWPTDQWQLGERVLDFQTLIWPEALPPGDYTLAVGWYTYPSLARLPLESDAALPDNRLRLGIVRYE